MDKMRTDRIHCYCCITHYSSLSPGLCLGEDYAAALSDVRAAASFRIA